MVNEHMIYPKVHPFQVWSTMCIISKRLHQRQTPTVPLIGQRQRRTGRAWDEARRGLWHALDQGLQDLVPPPLRLQLLPPLLRGAVHKGVLEQELLEPCLPRLFPGPAQPVAAERPQQEDWGPGTGAEVMDLGRVELHALPVRESLVLAVLTSQDMLAPLAQKAPLAGRARGLPEAEGAGQGGVKDITSIMNSS